MIKCRLLTGIMLFTITLPAIASDSEDFTNVEKEKWYEHFTNPKKVKWDGLRKAITIEDLNLFIGKQEKYDQKTIWGQLETSSNERDFACVKSFGNTSFCKCLGESLPAHLSFNGYVSIITGKNQKYYFSKMKASDIHILFNKVIEVRDSCVVK